MKAFENALNALLFSPKTCDYIYLCTQQVDKTAS